MALTAVEEKLVEVTESLSADELDELSRTADGGTLSPALRDKLQRIADGFSAEERAEVSAIGGADVEGFMIDQHRKHEQPDDIPTPGGSGSNVAGFGNRFGSNVKQLAGIFDSLF